MSFIIKIDNREKKIIDILDTLEESFTYVKENLDLGDIQIVSHETNDILVIIERKTLQDLSSSIKDGRYKEQKNRILNTALANVRKIYIFEGTNSSDFGLSQKIYESTIINSILRDNIHIYKSKSVLDTINFIKKINDNLPKYYDQLYNIVLNSNNVGQVLSSDIPCGLHQTKKKNNDHETCFHNMLCGIPGVSSKISGIFVEEFKNINKFFCYFKEELNNDKSKIIEYISNKKYGKNNRKIGNKVGLKIYLFLFQE
jgi:ERCC4-type nuclease